MTCTHFFTQGTCLILAIASLSSCDDADHDLRVAEYQKRLPAMERSGIVAGPGEKTFEEYYGVKVPLPMPEAEFLALLDRLKLPYELNGERGTQMIIPSPKHSKTVDASQMQKSYQIYGEIDPLHRSRAMFRAYVDEAGRVVYLENMFGYEGPG